MGITLLECNFDVQFCKSLNIHIYLVRTLPESNFDA